MHMSRFFQENLVHYKQLSDLPSAQNALSIARADVELLIIVFATEYSILSHNDEGRFCKHTSQNLAQQLTVHSKATAWYLQSDNRRVSREASFRMK